MQWLSHDKAATEEEDSSDYFPQTLPGIDDGEASEASSEASMKPNAR